MRWRVTPSANPPYVLRAGDCQCLSPKFTYSKANIARLGSSRCSTAEWVTPQKAAVYEKTLRISHSTRERVRSIGKDGNNGSQGQTTRHEQVAGSTPRPQCPLPRRVERIPARTQRAVGGGSG